MIDKYELQSAVGTYELLDDLAKYGFCVTISWLDGEYQISIERQFSEDDFTADEMVSDSLYGAVLRAWQEYIGEG